MKIKYKKKLLEIPQIINCKENGGLMGYVPKEKAYICFNIEGCESKITLKEFVKNHKNEYKEL